MFLLVFLYILLFVVKEIGTSNCPVSSQINVSKSHFVSYPESYLADEIIKTYPEGKKWICTSIYEHQRAYYERKFMKCTEQLCPIEDNYISLLFSAMSWKPYYSSSLCQWNSIKHVNIIALGGSMTRGVFTTGGCFSHFDPKYKNRPDSQHTIPKTWLTDMNMCSWPNFLERWANTFSPNISISTHNLGINGLGSSQMCDGVAYLLKKRRIILTSADIIFLDHSVNDGVAADSVAAKQGLECLIRTLYHYADGIPLNLIILEQFQHDNQQYQHQNTTHPADGGYTQYYRNIAEQYSLPLWSFRKIVWSNSTPIFRSTQLHEILQQHSSHPPWHHHLLLADIYAQAILTLLNDCHDTWKNTFHDSSTNTSSAVITSKTLPSRLYDASEIEKTLCDLSQPMLLDVTATSTFKPDNLESFEANLTGWTEYIDTNVPGWIINSRNYNANAHHLNNLSFPINYNSLDKNINEYIVKLKYLRTYSNAGMAKVYLCGRLLFSFDSLFKNFDTYKVSIPQLYADQPGKESPEFCLKDTNNGERKPTLDIVYKPGGGNFAKRLDQKVKVLSLQICRPTTFKFN